MLLIITTLFCTNACKNIQKNDLKKIGDSVSVVIEGRKVQVVKYKSSAKSKMDSVVLIIEGKEIPIVRYEIHKGEISDSLKKGDSSSMIVNNKKITIYNRSSCTNIKNFKKTH